MDGCWFALWHGNPKPARERRDSCRVVGRDEERPFPTQLRKLRIEKLGARHAEAWIVGEIWGDPSQWLEPACFDGVMNYRLAWTLLGFAGGSRLRRRLARPSRPYAPIDGLVCSQRLIDLHQSLPETLRRAQLNLLDSHDVPRALHVLGDDPGALSLALLLLFCLPGAPCLYYGTELGLNGGEEPACREARPLQGEAIAADLQIGRAHV